MTISDISGFRSHTVPTNLSSTLLYVDDFNAFRENMIYDFRDRIVYNDTYQTRATQEGTVSDFRYGGRDNNVRQMFAITKGQIFDFRNRVGDGDTH